MRTYLCLFKQYSTVLPNGKTIIFRDRGWGELGSSYSTSNKEEIKAIENLPRFKSGTIKLERVVEETPKTVSENPIDAQEYYTSRVQEAIDIIKKVCVERGIEYDTIRSREAVLQKAKELNISFPHLKL